MTRPEVARLAVICHPTSWNRPRIVNFPPGTAMVDLAYSGSINTTKHAKIITVERQLQGNNLGETSVNHNISVLDWENFFEHSAVAS